jgi:xanthine dehydrogenase YagT iron-sulfur-binding subunit
MEPGVGAVQQPSFEKTNPCPLERALLQRKSIRSYEAGRPLAPDEISRLLWVADGVDREDGHRTSPSARAKYPVDVATALPEGVYRYRPGGHRLDRVVAEGLRPQTVVQEGFKTAGMILPYVVCKDRVPVVRLAWGDLEIGCRGAKRVPRGCGPRPAEGPEPSDRAGREPDGLARRHEGGHPISQRRERVMGRKRQSRERELEQNGLSRRQFLGSVGASAAALAATGSLVRAADGPDGVLKPGEGNPLVLTVNGQPRSLLVDPRWTLLFVLREKLGLTGTKVGCDRGECGACTVLIDGVPRYACLTLAVEAEGLEVTTVEGLMRGEDLGPVQQAFVEHDAFQCGYCTPGQIMAVEGVLRKTPDPTPAAIRAGMSGNLCRCGAYTNIVAAIQQAMERS